MSFMIEARISGSVLPTQRINDWARGVVRHGFWKSVAAMMDLRVILKAGSPERNAF